MNKKIVSAVAMLALGATLAVAAPNEGAREGREGGHGHRGHHRRGAFGARLGKKLNLTDAQKQQMRDINASFREENKAFFTSFRQNMRDLRAARQANDIGKATQLSAALEAQRAQMKSLRQAQRTRVESILTAEQKAQLDQMKAQRAARHQERKAGR